MGREGIIIRPPSIQSFTLVIIFSIMPSDIVKNEWVEASDWDHPQNVALVFQDVSDISKGCGHALAWNAQHLVDAKSCPVCNVPVRYIVQGNADTSDMECLDSIAFKFGRQTFRISVSEDWNKDTASLSWISRVLQQWTQSHHTIRIDNHIKSALNLADGFKILHKGKLLYPPSDEGKRTPSLASISQKLLEIAHRGEIPVVMGTLQGQELREPPRKPSWTWLQLAQLPLAIAYVGVYSLWIFIKSFLAPFVPMLGIDRRPHED